MIRKITLLLACLITTFAISCVNNLPEHFEPVPAARYELDKSHSSIHFKVKHLGLSNYTARFTDFTINLGFDMDNPEASKVIATVNPNSIKTDYPFPNKKNFDKFLSQNENWFNSKKFPKITFNSTKIKRTSAQKGIMEGNLTMLGVTKPAKFKVTFNGSYKNKPFSNVPALGFSAIGKIKRSDWGFDTFVPSIGDEVEIIIETEFHKKPSKK